MPERSGLSIDALADRWREAKRRIHGRQDSEDLRGHPRLGIDRGAGARSVWPRWAKRDPHA